MASITAVPSSPKILEENISAAPCDFSHVASAIIPEVVENGSTVVTNINDKNNNVITLVSLSTDTSSISNGNDENLNVNKRTISPSKSFIESSDTLDSTPTSDIVNSPCAKRQKISNENVEEGRTDNIEIEERMYNIEIEEKWADKIEEKKEKEEANKKTVNYCNNKNNRNKNSRYRQKNRHQKEEEINIVTEEDRQRELEKIIKQIEYYFCDDNIRYDSFFQSKIQEAQMNGQDDEWLEMRWIMTAPRISKYNTILSEEEIIKCINEKSNFLKTKKEENNFWIKRVVKLPPLESRNDKNSQKHLINTNDKNKNKDYHIAGCLLKVTNIPEEITAWQTIKDELRKRMPDNAKSLIRFVSKIKKEGFCYLWCKNFKNDRNFFNDCEFEINGAKLKTSLLNDDTEIKKFLNEELTQHLRREREKEITKIRNRMRSDKCTQKIKLGNQIFNNIEHLRKCLKELLEKTVVNTVFKTNSNTANVLRSLLEYHPRKDAKLNGADDSVNIKFKVDLHEKKDSVTNEPVKSFFIVKMNKEAIESQVDFSFIKCLNELSKNPPVYEEEKDDVNEENKTENINKEEKEENKIEQDEGKDELQEFQKEEVDTEIEKTL